MKPGDKISVPYKPMGFIDAVKFLFHEFFINRPMIRRIQRDMKAGMTMDQIRVKYKIK